MAAAILASIRGADTPVHRRRVLDHRENARRQAGTRDSESPRQFIMLGRQACFTGAGQRAVPGQPAGAVPWAVSDLSARTAETQSPAETALETLSAPGCCSSGWLRCYAPGKPARTLTGRGGMAASSRTRAPSSRCSKHAVGVGLTCGLADTANARTRWRGCIRPGAGILARGASRRLGVGQVDQSLPVRGANGFTDLHPQGRDRRECMPQAKLRVYLPYARKLERMLLALITAGQAQPSDPCSSMIRV